MECKGREEPKAVLLNVVVRFMGEGGVKEVDPLKLTKIIREQVGEVKRERFRRWKQRR